MSRRVCPSCQRRWAGAVDADCPVCCGDGYLELGVSAVEQVGQDVVCRAIEFHLEAQARKDLTTPGTTLAQARSNLRASMGKLRIQRLLQATPGPPAARQPLRVAQADRKALGLVARHGADPQDVQGLDAPPMEFRVDERPLFAGGQLPGFSAAGFICHLARVTDPVDAFGDGNRDLMTGRYVSTRNAERLAVTIPLFR